MPYPACLNADYLDSLLEALGRETLADAFDTYRRTTAEALIRLRSELAAGQAEPSRRTAHFIASGSASIGALAAAGLARSLEHLPLDAPAATVADLVTRLASAVAECEAALAAILRP